MLSPKLPLWPDTLICNWKINMSLHINVKSHMELRWESITWFPALHRAETSWKKIKGAVTLNGTLETADPWGRLFSVPKEDFRCPAMEETFVWPLWRLDPALRTPPCWHFLPPLVSPLWWCPGRAWFSAPSWQIQQMSHWFYCHSAQIR